MMDKTPSLAARLRLNEIANNEKVEMKLGKKTYKIHRLGNWTSMKIMDLTWRSQTIIQNSNELTLNIDALICNRLVAPKIISYAILKYPWKIKLFHWAFWRKINKKYSQEDYTPALHKIYSYGVDLDFYLSNLTFLLQAAMPEVMMAKETMLSIVAKQNSAQKTTSLSPSTDKLTGTQNGGIGTGTA